MALIHTVPVKEAEGLIREGYEMFLKNIGIIPKPMEMMSASPALFELQLRRIQYFSKHPKLSFALLAHIRYLVAYNLNYRFCMDFNRHMLRKLGLEEAEIRKMEADPAQSALEENEGALLAFVVKAVKAPERVRPEAVEKLRTLGWEDRDIVDALAQGVSMIDHAIMMTAFQMDQNCMV